MTAGDSGLRELREIDPRAQQEEEFGKLSVVDRVEEHMLVVHHAKNRVSSVRSGFCATTSACSPEFYDVR